MCLLRSVLCLQLMCVKIRRPQRSPLFPYTTLFRSNEGEFVIVPRGVDHLPIASEETHVILLEPKPDRKSTRLNSSHRCTSYAAFFLKKKTKGRRAGGGYPPAGRAASASKVPRFVFS